MISVSPKIREIIRHNKSSDEITKAARGEGGFNMLFEEGLRAFLNGATTLGELQALPRGDYKLKSIEEIRRNAEIRRSVYLFDLADQGPRHPRRGPCIWGRQSRAVFTTYYSLASCRCL